jgi:chromosomal replication initiator protein
LTFARFVPTPENRSALAAVQQVAEYLGHDGSRSVPSPLFVHGPAGTGKSHLVSALVADATRRSPHLLVNVLQARDFEELARCQEQGDDPLESARQADLLVVEDLQHLGARGGHWLPAVQEAFVQVFDHRYARHLPMVFTATEGPGHLAALSARLISRLGCGLVVGLEPPQAASRLAILQDKAQRRQLAVRQEVLAWLAGEVRGSVRELEGALAQLELLSRLHARPPGVDIVAAHFREQVDAGRPTVERIAQRVSGYFRVEPRHLQSRRRSHKVLLPRQVGMYLARQLTDLSLDQIGSYFGGRDHSTVLHACRKVEAALARDAVLAGTVRQLHSDLG